ncbi:MAG: YggU family protein [Acidobacteria bacterium]|nr:YggU family protein [Acidobacteriota bacterium]
MIEVTESDRGVTFSVKVVPRASRTEIAGEIGGAVRVRVASPPVDGAANDELIRLIAKRLSVARSAVEIVSGAASKSKLVRVSGVTAGQLRDALAS